MVTEHDKQSALQRLESLLGTLPKDSAGKPACPFCGSGTGDHATSALQINKNTSSGKPAVYCHACKRWADSIQIARHIKGLSFPEAVCFLNGSIPESSKPQQPQQPKELKDRSRLLAYARKALHKLPEGEPGRKYLASRKVGSEAAKAFGLGYLSKSQAITIPTIDPRCFVSRQISAGATGSGQKSRYYVTGDKDISLLGNVLEKPFLCVCEGVFDTIALWNVMEPAERENIAFCSLNSVTSAGRLLDRLKVLDAWQGPSYAVLFLDNDSAGIDAAKKLESELKKLGIKSAIATLALYKDPAESWEAGDREAILDALRMAIPETWQEKLF